MTDIVERLRDRSDHYIAQHAMDTMDAAADEIERLRAALARLQAALGEASLRLKLLYMGASLGEKIGRGALAALKDEIAKIDAALGDIEQSGGAK